jgi:hypothetical protein
MYLSAGARGGQLRVDCDVVLVKAFGHALSLVNSIRILS